ncbi:MAG: dihydrofolate synthase [Ignavibacteria bacterium]
MRQRKSLLSPVGFEPTGVFGEVTLRCRYPVLSYNTTLRFLYGLQRRGMKFGLRNIRRLLASVGNPERRFLSIHVGGTNGKGSTSAFLASVFTEAGYKTGLYTSPHLVRFTERIRIDGKEMPEERLVEYVRALRPMVEQTRATFFEATTCVAFQYFADEKVDIAIVEVGLGGRLDSTNVIVPLLSVITNVSLEHTEYLGDTVEKIAREKGGIIKPHAPCVTASRDDGVVRTLQQIARRRHAPLYQVERRGATCVLREKKGTLHVAFTARRLHADNVTLGLAGRYQVVNAATAFAALDVLIADAKFVRRFPLVNVEGVRKGFERVLANTGLRGRLERVGKNFLLDVAHNADGMRTLVETLPARSSKNMIAVFGVLTDKDYASMCRLLGARVRHVVTVRAHTSRALPATTLAREFARCGYRATPARNVQHGLMIARKLAAPGDTILVTGSHYVVGEALTLIEQRNA